MKSYLIYCLILLYLCLLVRCGNSDERVSIAQSVQDSIAHVSRTTAYEGDSVGRKMQVEEHGNICSDTGIINFKCIGDGINLCSSNNGRIVIRLCVTAFHAEKHVIGRSDKYITTIDNHGCIGTDGSLPINQLDSLNLIVDGHKIIIPSKSYIDMYDMSDKCYEENYWIVCTSLTGFVLEFYGGDGAGAFTAKFKFEDGKYISRKIELRDSNG